MIIAIDIDGTWDQDEPLWKLFANNARNRGHKVYIVTQRKNDGDLNTIRPHVDGVVYTGGKPKRTFAAMMGVRPDVWIDDMPETIADPVPIIRG